MTAMSLLVVCVENILVKQRDELLGSQSVHENLSSTQMGMYMNMLMVGVRPDFSIVSSWLSILDGTWNQMNLCITKMESVQTIVLKILNYGSHGNHMGVELKIWSSLLKRCWLNTASR